MTCDRRSLSTHGDPSEGAPLIILMPTIGHPLMDIAAHIIEAEGVRFETAYLQGLRGVVGLIASFTIGHVHLKLIAPPKFSSGAATRGILFHSASLGSRKAFG